MNYIWPFLVTASFLYSFFNGSTLETLNAALNGAASAPSVLLSFAGIMCFWSGILNVAQKSGATDYCAKTLSPIIRRLFPTSAGSGDITMNIIANLLGMGNAATPAGLSAMRKLDKQNLESPHPGREMSRFVVLNTCSFQLLPTTVIGILSSAGSKNPFSVVPMIWISSLFSLACALFADALLNRERRCGK